MGGTVALKFQDVQNILELSDQQVTSRLPKLPKAQKIATKSFLSLEAVKALLEIPLLMEDLVREHWSELPESVRVRLESVSLRVFSEPHHEWDNLTEVRQSVLINLSLAWASLRLRKNVFREFEESVLRLSQVILEKIESSDPVYQSVVLAASSPSTQDELSSADELIKRVFARIDDSSSHSSEEVWRRFDKAWADATRESQDRC